MIRTTNWGNSVRIIDSEALPVIKALIERRMGQSCNAVAQTLLIVVSHLPETVHLEIINALDDIYTWEIVE